MERLPKSIAKTVSMTAAHSAPSKSNGCAGPPGAVAVSVAKPLAIERSCRAMYGTKPTTATTVTGAATPAERPKRAPMKSAIDVILFAFEMRSMRRMTIGPRQKASVGPR
jgi:hypothetical protein